MVINLLIKRLIFASIVLVILGYVFIYNSHLVIAAIKYLKEFISKYLSLTRIASGLVVCALCFVIEIIAMGWKNSSLFKILFRQSGTVKVDILAYLFSTLRILDILAIIFSFGISTFLPSWIRSFAGYNLLASLESPILQNILFVIIMDFTLYWIHRFNHTISILWEIHKFHHSATELTIITTARLHPIEIAINNVIFSLPLFIIGVPVETYLAFFFFTNWLGHIHHSMLPWDWGLIGKYVFLSPAAHRLHHSLEEKHFNKNFGTVTPLWDRIFGTWYYGNDLNEEVGIDENEFNKSGIFYDYIISYRRFIKNIINFMSKYLSKCFKSVNS